MIASIEDENDEIKIDTLVAFPISPSSVVLRENVAKQIANNASQVFQSNLYLRDFEVLESSNITLYQENVSSTPSPLALPGISIPSSPNKVCDSIWLTSLGMKHF